jgi:hypothetical protein
VTAQDSPDAEPESLDDPMSLEGFERVGRTRWIVTTAGRKERRYADLVAPDQQHAYGSHQPDVFCSRWPIELTSSASCWKVESYASGFARMRRSVRSRWGRSCVRTSSRKRLLTRFRSTIFRRCFGTTTPTRGCSNREAHTRASRRSVWIRFPVRRTVSRSVSLVRRAARGNPNGLGAGVFRW